MSLKGLGTHTSPTNLLHFIFVQDPISRHVVHKENFVYSCLCGFKASIWSKAVVAEMSDPDQAGVEVAFHILDSGGEPWRLLTLKSRENTLPPEHR